jgi:hypothetical protein
VTLETRTVHQFASLFSGRTDAYGTGQGRWIKEAVTEGLYRVHLAGGGHGLGIAPLLDDGTVRFAAIDLDEPDFDAAEEMKDYLPGTAFIERSRSGNAHVWVFFNAPIEAWIPRGILKEAILAAGKQHVEIFPKQDRLLPGMLGNYINLPFHGDSRPILRRGPNIEGLYPAYLDEFVDVAMDSLNDPAEWSKRAKWLCIGPPEQRTGERSEFGKQEQLHMCAEYMIANCIENPVVEGHRAVVFFALAKQLLNCVLFDEAETLRIMRSVNEESPDPVPDSELHRIIANVMRGQFTSTGCDDPMFAPYAHPDCKIARGQ